MHVLPHPPLSSPVRLSQAAAATIRTATVASLPHEACGLLFGDPTTIAHATIACNIAAEPWHRFEIDPAHLFDAQRRDRDGPDRLIGCWHSHPNGQPTPSASDRAGVIDMGWLWLIAAGPLIRAWRPSAAGFEPVAMAQVGS